MPHPGPKVIQLVAGRHAICTCGRSAKAPVCDGSHKGSSYTPELVDVDAPGRTCAWCTCRATKNAPYCDGSHKTL